MNTQASARRTRLTPTRPFLNPCFIYLPWTKLEGNLWATEAVRVSASGVSRERSAWLIWTGVKQSANFFARKTSVIDFSLSICWSPVVINWHILIHAPCFLARQIVPLSLFPTLGLSPPEWIMRHWVTNESQKREHVTREVGFLWQVYKPLSDYWSETMVSLKVAEPKQPTTDNCPMRSANSLANCR